MPSGYLPWNFWSKWSFLRWFWVKFSGKNTTPNTPTLARVIGKWYTGAVVIEKGFEMKVMYTSPVFRNADGSARQAMIPLAAIETYAKRDAALIAMIELGGIYAKPTPEFLALRKKMMAAKRKITKNSWFSQLV